jgi:hypothetical protein
MAVLVQLFGVRKPIVARVELISSHRPAIVTRHRSYYFDVDTDRVRKTLADDLYVFLTFGNDEKSKKMSKRQTGVNFSAT